MRKIVFWTLWILCCMAYVILYSFARVLGIVTQWLRYRIPRVTAFIGRLDEWAYPEDFTEDDGKPADKGWLQTVHLALRAD